MVDFTEQELIDLLESVKKQMPIVAQTIKVLFDELVKEGFTEEQAMQMKLATDLVEYQTKTTDLKQKMFDLQKDQLMLPAEVDKAMADIERINASIYSAIQSGNASAASSELADLPYGRKDRLCE